MNDRKLNQRIIFRLPVEMSAAARQLVEKGQYQNLSDVLRDALSRLLDEVKKNEP